jgi:hypothetical protein
VRPIRSLALTLAAACALAAPLRAQEPPEPRVGRLLPGDTAVDASRIAPSTDTFRMVIVAGGQSVEAGRIVLETKDIGGGLLQRVYTASGAQSRVDSLAVDAATLRAVWLRTARGGRRLALTWDGAVTGGTITEGDRTAPVVAPLPSAVFARDATDLVLRAQRLHDDWARAWPVYDDMRGARTWMWAGVSGAETLTLSDGTRVDTWHVSINDGPDVVSYWMARDDGRFIRYAGAMAGGATFVITR